MKSYIFSLNKNSNTDVISILNEYNKYSDTLMLGHLNIDIFSDNEISPNFQQSIRGSKVYLYSNETGHDALFKLFLAIDAARRASAKEVVAVIGYLPYSRQDRKDGKRGTVGAKTMANLLVASGANRIITMDLHAEQIEGFYDIPVDHIVGQRLFENWITERFESNDFTDLVLCSPDAGGVKRVDKYWRRLGEKYNVTNAYISKFRSKPNSIDRMELNGSVENKDVIIIDDMIDTAGTLCKAALLLKEKGAKRVFAIATHGVLSGKAIENLNNSVIEKIIISNTIATVNDKADVCDKITVLDIAEQFAKFILANDIDASPSEFLK